MLIAAPVSALLPINVTLPWKWTAEARRYMELPILFMKELYTRKESYTRCMLAVATKTDDYIQTHVHTITCTHVSPLMIRFTLRASTTPSLSEAMLAVNEQSLMYTLVSEDAKSGSKSPR